MLAIITVPLVVLYTDYAIGNQAKPEQQAESVLAPRVTVLPRHADTHRSHIQAFAEVQAVDEIALRSQVTGKVVWRNPAFVAGGQVKQGTELLRLDKRDFQTAVAAAKQVLAEAKLAVQQERQQMRQAEREWQRSGLKDKPSALLLRGPQLKAAQARQQAAKAALLKAERDLARTRIKAPFAAVIMQRSAAVGSYLQAGESIATLRSSDHAEVAVALSAQQWQLLPTDPVGMPVTLYSRDQPEVSWQGKVIRSVASINQQTRLRNLIVSVEQPLRQAVPLLFGSFVQVDIKGRNIEDVFAIPSAALTADGYIWLEVDEQLQRYRTTPRFSYQGQLFIDQGDLPEKIHLVRKPLASYLPGMQVSSQLVEGEYE